MTVGTFVDAGAADGFIVAWHGTISNIPAGWVLCDGNNATPDLRARFVKGTGSASEIPGTNDGQDSVTLSEGQLPAHSHGGSTSSDGSHDHTFDAFGTIYSGGSSVDPPLNTSGDTKNVSTSTNGSHSHSTSLGTTGSGSSIENRPSYYELAFIMKT